MANALYGKGREGFATGTISWTSDNIKVCLVDSADYTLSIDTHDFLDDIPGGAIIATSGNLSGKSATLGVCDADDVTFTSVSGDQFEYVIIYKDSGSSATSPLIACLDTATGLALTPNGADITLTWSNGSNKIFKL